MNRRILVALMIGWLLGLASPVVAFLALAMFAMRRRPDDLTAHDLDAHAAL